MAEKWLQEYESAEKYAQEIFQKLNEFKQLPTGNSQRGKVSATVRKMVVAFDKDLEKLSKDLSSHARNGSITEREANRRRTLIDNIQQSQKEIQNTLRNTSDSEWARQKTDPRTIAVTETESTQALTNDQFQGVQSTLRKTNDDAIGALHAIVIRQKEIGIAMNSEVDRHNEIITNVTDHTSLLDSRIKRETSYMKFIDKKSKTTVMWIIIVLLLIAIIVICVVPF